MTLVLLLKLNHCSWHFHEHRQMKSVLLHLCGIDTLMQVPVFDSTSSAVILTSKQCMKHVRCPAKTLTRFMVTGQVFQIECYSWAHNFVCIEVAVRAIKINCNCVSVIFLMLICNDAVRCNLRMCSIVHNAAKLLHCPMCCI